MDFETIPEDSKREKLFANCTKVEYEILEMKGHDYAKSSDFLSNFRITANLEERSVEAVILSEITKKNIRLNELINGNKTPKNESILDTIHDLRNYGFLLYSALYEKEKTAKNWAEKENKQRQPLNADRGLLK